MVKKIKDSRKISQEIPKRKQILRSGYLTVGRLKEFIKEHNIPDNALILYQRIEDVYFNKHGWNKSLCTVRKANCTFPEMRRFKKYDDVFVTVWSPIKYRKDNNLYLTAHY